MYECYERWYHDEDLRKECTQEYLEKRKQYRLTGKSDQLKRVAS